MRRNLSLSISFRKAGKVGVYGVLTPLLDLVGVCRIACEIMSKTV